ncbi:MAG: DUF1993 domain-containing protein [Candidatus Moranbacteria bacterium]|nr:DUF1993 domain-containing protein [Candidatus Moranbacteria bacterium]
MAKISMYNATVPEFKRSLLALQAILVKAEAFVAEKKIADSVLLGAYLALDQFPFVKQVQVVCDTAKGTAGRLAGVELPKMEDNEVTLKELEARIDKTIAFLDSLKPEQFEGAEDREIPIYYFPGKALSGLEYVNAQGLPNFYFHLTTAYSILRHNGMNIGKADYMGQVAFHDEKK